MFYLDLVTCQLSVLFILEINNKENKTMSYYVWIGVCPNKSAYDLYQEYIRASDGYCHDELQEETDFTWTIFTRVDYDDWFDYPYHLRYQKQMVNGIRFSIKGDCNCFACQSTNIFNSGPLITVVRCSSNRSYNSSTKICC